MSDYHILSTSRDKKTIRVIFHIPIPSTGTNEANVSWQTAVAMELGGAANISSVLPGISGAEETAMKAGQILEVTETVRFTSLNLTVQQRKTEIEGAFTATKASIVAEKQETLAFMGYEGSVA